MVKYTSGIPFLPSLMLFTRILAIDHPKYWKPHHIIEIHRFPNDHSYDLSLFHPHAVRHWPIIASIDCVADLPQMQKTKNDGTDHTSLSFWFSPWIYIEQWFAQACARYSRIYKCIEISNIHIIAFMTFVAISHSGRVHSRTLIMWFIVICAYSLCLADAMKEHIHMHWSAVHRVCAHRLLSAPSYAHCTFALLGRKPKRILKKKRRRNQRIARSPLQHGYLILSGNENRI